MEERIIDKDELRKVRVTRTDGALDVVDDTLPEAAPEEGEAELGAEYAVEFEGESYDEDLVGLTPSQYREEIERRARAAQEAHEACEALCAEGDGLLAAGNWQAAEEKFEEAMSREPQSERAEAGLWSARTQAYASDEVFYTERGAREFAAAGDGVRAKAMEAFGEQLRAAQGELRAEADELRKTVEAGQAERRAPFRANFCYYRLRLCIALAVFALFLVGIGVSASYILRVQSATPVILTGTFGALAFAAFVAVVLFSRKTLVAARLVRENEKLSSTEEGARLLLLDNRLACLAVVLGGAEDGPQTEEA